MTNRVPTVTPDPYEAAYSRGWIDATRAAADWFAQQGHDRCTAAWSPTIEYDADEATLIATEPEGASEIVAHNVAAWFGLRFTEPKP